MGYTITPQQQKEMQKVLDVDENGKVIFAEFVKLAQEMFAFKLEEGSHYLIEALTHREDLEMPPMPRKVSTVGVEVAIEMACTASYLLHPKLPNLPIGS
jgi:hypothetical protein